MFCTCLGRPGAGCVLLLAAFGLPLGLTWPSVLLWAWSLELVAVPGLGFGDASGLCLGLLRSFEIAIIRYLIVIIKKTPRPASISLGFILVSSLRLL